MLNLENIKKSFISVDDRPTVVWEGNVGSAKNHRIVFTKKNTLAIEAFTASDAMGNKIWTKNVEPFIEAEIFTSALIEAFSKLSGVI